MACVYTVFDQSWIYMQCTLKFTLPPTRFAAPILLDATVFPFQLLNRPGLQPCAVAVWVRAKMLWHDFCERELAIEKLARD